MPLRTDHFCGILFKRIPQGLPAIAQLEETHVPNLTVVLYNSDLSVAYKGSLSIQFDMNGNPTGGSLTLGSFAPVTLTAQSIPSQLWSLTGSNSDVNVQSSTMDSASSAENTTVTEASVAGYITVSVQGGAAQDLMIFGWDPAVFPWPAGNPAARGGVALNRASMAVTRTRDAVTADAGVSAQAFPAPDHFNYNIALLGQNTFNVGTGGLAVVGQFVHVGPVGRAYRVAGNLTFSGGVVCPLTGGGSAAFWAANAQAGFFYYDVSTVINPQGIAQGCVGGLLLDGSSGGIVFFVGTAS